jgi:hypothetical protein
MIVLYTKTFITNVVTGEQVSGQVLEPTSPAYSVRGEIRGYVGGRQRAIGREGTAGTWGFTLVELLAASVTSLEEWMASGATVFARNHLGDSMYGVFFNVDPQPVKAAAPGAGAAWSVQVDLRMVDVVEGL